MHAAREKDHHRIARPAPAWEPSALPGTDALLSELGVLLPLIAYAGCEDDPSPTDSWEASSGSSAPDTVEERRSEMDRRIMAGMLWS